MTGDDRLAISSNKGGDWYLYTVSASGGELRPLLKKPFKREVLLKVAHELCGAP